MAYQQNHHRTSSTGLASSISCLDGVPFKIGVKFKTPPRFMCPDEIKERQRCPALNEEYMFETEEAVLAWAKAREELKEQARQEAAEQARQEIAEQAEDAVSDSEDSSDDDNNMDGIDKSTSVDISQPVAAAMSNNILTPVPITSTKQEQPDTSSRVVDIDLTMFEKEEDLFDNIDRQMINEMEELKTVLQPPAPPNDSNTNSNNNNTVAERNNSTLTAVSESVECSQKSEYTCDNRPVPLVRPVPAVRKSKLSGKFSEGEYVELKKDFNSDVVFFSKSSNTADGTDPGESDVTKTHKQLLPDRNNSLEIHRAGPLDKDDSQENNKIIQQSNLFDDVNGTCSVTGGSLPYQLVANNLVKPVLPPVRTVLPPIQPKPPPVHTAPPVSQSPPPKPARLVHTASVSQSPPPTQPPPPKPVRPAPPPPQNRNLITSGVKKDNLINFLPCKRHSVPILNSGMSQQTDCMSVSSDCASLSCSLLSQSDVIGSKYSRHLQNASPCGSSSQSDVSPSSPIFSVSPPPARPSSQQLWNPYKPLPLPTSVSQDSSSSEFDPYTVLSEEEQKFVNNLTDMGFTRPLVARAVARLGTNEREVLDFLDSMDKLCEKGYSTVLSEAALQMYDIKKAVEYLQLYSQFQELGFGTEKIKEALVKENLDRDKALDLLTS